MRRLRVGLMGAGLVGQAEHAFYLWEERARFEFVALADAFEAVMGAVFLDGGYEAARGFILRDFGGYLSAIQVIPTMENPKGELQEFLQATSAEAPQYHVVSATGPDHARTFECTVHHNGVELARGAGRSKKAAESEAALAALEKLRALKAPNAAAPTSDA